LRVLVVVMIIVVGKFLAALGIVVALRHPPKYGADGIGRAGTNRGILLHSGRNGDHSWLVARRRAGFGVGGGTVVDHVESVGVPRVSKLKPA